MGWLSLATRIVPKVWRAGSKATSTVWHGGSAVLGAGGKVLTTAARNPKTTAAVGIGAFAGWHHLEHPEDSMGTSVGKTLREGASGTKDFLHDTVNGFTGENTVEKVQETTSSVINGLKETVSESKGILGTLGDTLKGISTFLGNIFGGNGMNMFANFFNNISSGKVSGLSIGGLIAAGYMMFGRTGLLGKIGGALLTMMLIGGNSRQQTQAVSQTAVPQQTQEQQAAIHR